MTMYVRRAVVVPDSAGALARVAVGEPDETMERRRPHPPQINRPGAAIAEPSGIDLQKLMEKLRGGMLKTEGARIVLQMTGAREDGFSVLARGRGLFTPVEKAYTRDARIMGIVFNIKNTSRTERRGEMLDAGTYLLKPLDGFYANAEELLAENYGIGNDDIVIPMGTAMAAGIHSGDTLALYRNPIVLPTPTL